MISTPRPGTSWREAIRVYRHPRVIAMLFLGFSAGLPFLLVFSTLTAWLRDVGVDVAAIGFFSWIGIMYSIKVLWAPVVDRIPLPPLTTWFGKRRGWMLAAQLIIMLGLALMAYTDPTGNLWLMAGVALLVAFGSATQDISLDAYRIEAVADELQPAMASTYQLGYRLAIITSGAGALYIADYASWQVAYTIMAALMGIGIMATLITREPEHFVEPFTAEREARVVDFIKRRAHWPHWLREAGAWLIGAVLCPLVDFLARYRGTALLLLLLIGLFKVSDLSMAAMANPLYIDLGFSLSQIAFITKVFGVIVSILGVLTGGLLAVRFGMLPMLLVAGIAVSATNLLFSWLVGVGDNLLALTLVIGADNFASGLSGTVFIAFLSSLTNRVYTATQYALFSSLMTLPGKFIGGFSGVIVDAQGYAYFFVYSALIGVPAILLVLYLMYRADVGQTVAKNSRSEISGGLT
jgi:MFS transporter, PAT family, beta-lactamase induction signal transducer AmpG